MKRTSGKLTLFPMHLVPGCNGLIGRDTTGFKRDCRAEVDHEASYAFVLSYPTSGYPDTRSSEPKCWVNKGRVVVPLRCQRVDD